MGHLSGPQCHLIEDCGGKPKLAKATRGTCMEGRVGWESRATWLCSRGAWKLLFKAMLAENAASSYGNFIEVMVVIAAVVTPLSYFTPS